MQRGPKAKLPCHIFNLFNLPMRLSPPSHDSADRQLRPVTRMHDFRGFMAFYSGTGKTCVIALHDVALSLLFQLISNTFSDDMT